MAKTNSTRQAEFRARMRDEGKQALHIWVTPEQAAKVQAVINPVEPVLATPLRLTKPTGKPVPLPVIPIKAPAAIVRELKDVDGIESWYRQTVAACNNL